MITAEQNIVYNAIVCDAACRMAINCIVAAVLRRSASRLLLLLLLADDCEVLLKKCCSHGAPISFRLAVELQTLDRRLSALLATRRPTDRPTDAWSATSSDSVTPFCFLLFYLSFLVVYFTAWRYAI